MSGFYREVEHMTVIGGSLTCPQIDRSQLGQSHFSQNSIKDKKMLTGAAVDRSAAPGISRAGTTRIGEAMCAGKSSYEDIGKSWQMRRLARKLTQTREEKKQKTFTARSEDKENDFLSLFGNIENKEEEKAVAEPKYEYNYKEVANKIKQAKTSESAEQAVISAKRKVMEVKRKIASGAGNAEELQLALTHATRMEMAARKKKNHLELEEMIMTTQRRDEQLDKQEDAVTDMRTAVIDSAEEKLNKAEDDIFIQRQDMIEEAVAEMKENGEDVSDEAMAELNEMIAEYGEEEIEKLEDAMDQLELMEVVDPHMSEEDLEELKRKHRLAEQKAIMKADMDYLKGVIKLQMQKGAEAAQGAGSGNGSGGLGNGAGGRSVIPGIGGSTGGITGANFSQAPVPAVSSVFTAMTGDAPAGDVSVDIQV